MWIYCLQIVWKPRMFPIYTTMIIEGGPPMSTTSAQGSNVLEHWNLASCFRSWALESCIPGDFVAQFSLKSTESVTWLAKWLSSASCPASQLGWSTEYNSDVVVLLLTISWGNCPNTAGPTNYCSKKAGCCLMWMMSQFIWERVHKLSGWFHAQSHLIMLKCDTCLGSVHWTSILCLDC